MRVKPKTPYSMTVDIETLKRIETELGRFDVKQVCGGSNDIYLRFGYWRRIDTSKLQNIVGTSVRVVEDDIDDDDCGTLYSYKLK
jgi:hypothetical protein